MKKIVLISFITISQTVFSQKTSKKDYLVTLTTDFGSMHIVLYDEAPLHKQNFIQLIEQKFYDGLLFHRIIDDFMIQGGDPNSRNAKAGEHLGAGDAKPEKIPFEFKSNRIHKKGALAAARDNNPEKKSSSSQFYIVEGKPRTDEEMKMFIAQNKMNYTPEQIQIYKTLGGTPHLDNNYTVFGEVIDNLDIIGEIAKQPRNQEDRPNQDIRMSLKVERLRKKKITKKYGYKF